MIAFSSGSSQPRDAAVSLMSPALAGGFFTANATREAQKQAFIVIKSLSHVWLFAIPWTAVYQASLSITIYWNLVKL